MSYLLAYPEVVAGLLARHLLMALVALALAAALALPLAWLLHRRPRLSAAVQGIFGVIYSIPSLALMILLLPVFGLNAGAVIAALVLYAQIILLRNALAGLQGVDPAALEAARGMGMSPRQVALRVQWPLALPVVLAGVRLAAIVTIAIATVGAKFGAGGLGVLLFDGISQNRPDKLWLGALVVSLLAWSFQRGLLALERRLWRWRTAV